VGELIGEAQLVVNWDAYPDDVTVLIHAHLTENEAVGEGAPRARRQAIARRLVMPDRPACLAVLTGPSGQAGQYRGACGAT